MGLLSCDIGKETLVRVLELKLERACQRFHCCVVGGMPCDMSGDFRGKAKLRILVLTDLHSNRRQSLCVLARGAVGSYEL